MTPDDRADAPAETAQRRHLPGDLDAEARLARVPRVDHAGEYGARRIYEGQLAVLGRSACAPTLRHMHAPQLAPLSTLEALQIGRASCRDRVCPAAWIPVGAESLKK